jgi:hypothetical protein
MSLRKPHQKVCPLFGQAKDFLQKYLPSKADIILCFLHVQTEMNHDLKRNNTPRKMLATEVCHRLLLIWSKSGIPVITERRITMMILESVDCYKNKLRNQENIPSSWISSWKKNLFDIAACKCSKDCSCPENRKIPSRKVKLITDLRQQKRRSMNFKPQTISQSNEPYGK